MHLQVSRFFVFSRTCVQQHVPVLDSVLDYASPICNPGQSGHLAKCVVRLVWLTIYQQLLVTIICFPFSLKPVGIGIPYLKKWSS